MLKIIVAAITIGVCVGLVMRGAYAVWWLWLVSWADLERMTAPLTPADREALRKAEEFSSVLVSSESIVGEEEAATSLIGVGSRN